MAKVVRVRPPPRPPAFVRKQNQRFCFLTSPWQASRAKRDGNDTANPKGKTAAVESHGSPWHFALRLSPCCGLAARYALRCLRLNASRYSFREIRTVWDLTVPEALFTCTVAAELDGAEFESREEAEANEDAVK